MWWQSKTPIEHNIEDMVRGELRRLGYAGRQSVPKQVFHTALGFVCHRLLENCVGSDWEKGQYGAIGTAR